MAPERLFKPIQVGDVTLENRMVMAALAIYVIDILLPQL